MADVNTAAASSPALSAVEPGTTTVLTREMKDSWNKGLAPVTEEKPQAESAPAIEDSSSATDASAEEGESAEVETSPAPEAEKPPKQAPPKRDNAESRKAQLNAEIRELLKKRDQIKAEVEPPKTEPKAESSTAKPPAEPQTYADWRKGFNANKWVDEWAKSNPEATYEEAIAAMNDHIDQAREGFRSREQQQREMKREFDARLAEARGRYENFDETAKATATVIVTDDAIPMPVKVMLNESEVFPDLLYTIGSKPEEMQKFISMARENPGKALRYIALTESLIREELEAPKDEAKPEKKPVETQTKAPKPPAEVGGRANTPQDEELEAVSSGDYRKASAVWRRKAVASMK